MKGLLLKIKYLKYLINLKNLNFNKIYQKDLQKTIFKNKTNQKI